MIDGARWIARAASQVEIDEMDAFAVRSLFIRHAGDEWLRGYPARYRPRSIP